MARKGRAWVLLGGLVGWDGVADSVGMEWLAEMLAKIPGLTVTTLPWENYGDVVLGSGAPGDAAIVVGYSGGGSRSTWLARLAATREANVIDLMILYDPSPEWEMKPIGPNVKHVVVYHCTHPLMPMHLGGGVVTLKPGNDVTKVEVFDTALPHIVIQAARGLHNFTIGEIKRLLG